MFTTENKDGKWWVVEVVGEKPKPNSYTHPALYLEAFEEWSTLNGLRKQYPTLPEHASHWAALQGKMFGEGEFEVQNHYGMWMKYRNGESKTVLKVKELLHPDYLHDATLQWAEETGNGANYGFTYGHDEEPTSYAIPKQQPKEQGEVNFNSPEIQQQLAVVKEGINQVMENAKPAQQSQPAPTDTSGWEEVMNTINEKYATHIDHSVILKHALDYLTTNYEAPKRKNNG